MQGAVACFLRTSGVDPVWLANGSTHDLRPCSSVATWSSQVSTAACRVSGAGSTGAHQGAVIPTARIRPTALAACARAVASAPSVSQDRGANVLRLQAQSRTGKSASPPSLVRAARIALLQRSADLLSPCFMIAGVPCTLAPLAFRRGSFRSLSGTPILRAPSSNSDRASAAAWAVCPGGAVNSDIPLQDQCQVWGARLVGLCYRVP